MKEVEAAIGNDGEAMIRGSGTGRKLVLVDGLNNGVKYSYLLINNMDNS